MTSVHPYRLVHVHGDNTGLSGVAAFKAPALNGVNAALGEHLKNVIPNAVRGNTCDRAIKQQGITRAIGEQSSP
jgi:hypothetical protein